jgi:hypothetical protein
MARPVRDLSLASYDWRAFGHAVRAAAMNDGRLDRAIAAEIGVTATAFSKAQSGGNIGIDYVFAICDWMGNTPRDFYRNPKKSNTCTLFRVKQGSCETSRETLENC